ncbi:MAG: glycerol-3-phosphate ABC transporter ATP-binding protein [Elusimicrobia bacterium RIFCSPLOWO2_01_FULL_64_13]|nr:MAG: glycerol-3-phosphate ABC transporter ATP-binding protein [Elusimicrobia bacterium RIFCSPHIGHO2_01_FULL_64_10]OGR95955.1 MAG: glycerol-3-phosphate ABC transporter ATP-binding protein [Elusimicrobia bacterium RIFCSPLOWO2_01_FULL_64_13]
MAEVILKNVSKEFESNQVVQSISLDIRDKEFFVLVGPSGCGKSTTLRMIAGLEEATDGEIWIGGKLVNDIPPKDRDIAMVFQNYALYPHMTVYENMAFGLKLRGYSKKEIDARVREAGEILNMTGLFQRKPKELSGGQRQRVAVGRAIVRKPKVFLFDEPLSNLDAKLRVQMRTELSKLHDRLQTTMIYVTHDQVEAMTMGDKICVMKDGVIQQIAPPLELYDRPSSRFVAGFIGSPPMNFLDVNIVDKNQKGLWLKEVGADKSSDSFQLKLMPDMESVARNHLGKTVVLGIRPEDIFDRLFYAGQIREGSTARVTVEVVEPMGPEKYLYLNTGKNSLVARVEPHNSAKPQQDIDLVFNVSTIHLFDAETGKTII